MAGRFARRIGSDAGNGGTGSDAGRIRDTDDANGIRAGRHAPVIRCRDLAVGHGGDPVLTDVSFDVRPGETLALVGRSGSGKTTLLKTLAGTLDPLAGEGTVLGTTLPSPPPAGEVGYVPQGLGLVEHATVERNVLHGTLSDLGPVRSILGRFPSETRERAHEALETVELGGTADRRVASLSGGQRRRVAIARALVQAPRVLLADEILSELDGETAEAIVDALRTLQAETGAAVVIVEHDLAVATALADRVGHIENGALRETAGGRSDNRVDERGERVERDEPDERDRLQSSHGRDEDQRDSPTGGDPS